MSDDTVTVRDANGRSYEIPSGYASAAQVQGLTPESEEEGIARVTQGLREERYGGVGGAIKAGAAGVASGLTLGLSDLAIAGAGGGFDLEQLNQEHPYASVGGQIVGAIAPTILTAGAAAPEEGAAIGARLAAKAAGRALKVSPAGLTSSLGRTITEHAAGAAPGFLRQTAATTAGAAAEGALYGGGQYLSQVALEDKPLSAEGFVAGMGKGALFAAPVGAGFAIAGSALTRARALFPRSVVSEAAAAGVKQDAQSAIAQSVGDGETMADAARRKLGIVEAQVGTAEAGESVTRKMFGDAHPQSIADQVGGNVERTQISEALKKYEASDAQFRAWVAAGGDAELEAALSGLATPGLAPPGVPVGEFGAPGARGYNPGEIAAPRPPTAVEAVTGDVTVAGKKKIAQGTPVVSPEVNAGIPEAQPATTHFDFKDSGLTFDPSTQSYFSAEGPKIPDYATLKASKANYVEATVPAREIAERGYYEPPGGHADAVRTDKARKAIADGQREPISLNVTPSGKITVHDGRHRLQAAIDADAPIVVKWSTGYEPAADDVLRATGREAPRIAAPADDLMAALQGTKEGLDAGKTIGQVRRGEGVSAAARDDLEALLGGMKSKLDAGANLGALGAPGRAEYAAAKAERTAAAAEHFRGKANSKNYAATPMAADEAAAQAAAVAERAPLGSVDDLKQLIAGMRPAEPQVTSLFGKRAFVGDAAQATPVSAAEYAARRESLGKRILNHAGEPASVEGQAGKILGKRSGRNVDMGPDLARAAKVIGDHESALAGLVDVLGAEAPASAAANAKALREAVRGQAEALGGNAAKAAQGIAGHGITPGWVPPPHMAPTVVDDAVAKALRMNDAKLAAKGSAGADVTVVDSDAIRAMRAQDSKLVPPTPAAAAAVAGPGAAGKLANVGAALEVLKALGVHVPAISAIPVIGPVLGLFLKARAVMSILGRKGGSVGKSTDTLIAAKAAEIRNRINVAVGQTLETGARGARKAAAISAGPAALLGHKLFPGDGDTTSKDPIALYHARMDEIARAQQPNAIDHAISDRYQASDPAMHDALVQQVQRGISFLDSKAPKQNVAPGMIPGDGTWTPSRNALEQFGRYVHAVNDPVSVLEDLAKGHVTMEGAETLRVVYPRLFAEAQQALMQAAPVMQTTLPYSRRVMISIVYRIPVDSTMTDAHKLFLQPPPTPAGAGPGAMPGGGPPQMAPAILGPLSIGKQTATSLDRRAGA